MSDIFISYSRKDIELAEKIVGTLAKNNLDTWVDWKNIPKGEDWWERIKRGIEEADAFLFLVSPDSVFSDVCNREIAYAVENGKRILPVYIRDTGDNNIPGIIRKYNWIYSRKGKDSFDEAINDIITTIHTDHDWLQFHTELQVKAKEWKRKNGEKSLLLHGKELEAAERMMGLKAGLEPHPVDLQREYLVASRQVENRQRRRTVIVLSVGLGLMIVLFVVAWNQRNIAVSETNAKTTALVNEQNAVATAQAETNARATAQANAEEQALIALQRQLASQAQSIYTLGDSRELLAVLLAIQATKIFPSREALDVLQNTTLAYAASIEYLYPIATQQDAFSSDERYGAAVGYDKTVRVWDVKTNTEFLNIPFDAGKLVFSKDGKLLALASNSFSSSHTVSVWDVESKEELYRLEHEHAISSVEFSPDGTQLAAGSSDGSIYLWNLSNNSEPFIFSHDAAVTSVDFSPDGKFIVSGSEDNTARIWNIDTLTEIARVNQGGVVGSVKFSPDGVHVVSAGCKTNLGFGGIRCLQQGIIQVWDATSGTIISQMRHDDLVTSLDFNKDGRYVVSGSFDNTARVWEASSGQEVARMTHDGFVLFVNFLPEDNKIVSRTITNIAWIWDWTARKNNIVMDQGSLIPALAFSSTGEHLISGSYDSIARTWDIDNGKEIARKEHDYFVESVAFSSDNEYVLSAGGNTVYVWDPQNGDEKNHVTRDGQVSVLALSPDDKLFASGVCEQKDETNYCTHGVVYISETLTGKDFTKVIHTAGVYSLAFSPDGSLVASGGCDERGSNGICINGSTHIVEATTGIEIASITHRSTVRAVGFTPDGRYLISGSEDRTASVWDVSVGNELFRFNHGNIGTLAISPDGKYAATAGCDQRDDIDRQCMEGSVRIWEISTGLEISRMFHDNQVNSVAFSSDGEYVISGSWDRTARVWETMTGNEISRKEHNGAVIVVAFDPNGKFAASGGEDGLIRLWVWNPEDLVEDACLRVTRNLTRTEWDQYIGNAMLYEAVCPNLPVEPKPAQSP